MVERQIEPFSFEEADQVIDGRPHQPRILLAK